MGIAMKATHKNGKDSMVPLVMATTQASACMTNCNNTAPGEEEASQ